MVYDEFYEKIDGLMMGKSAYDFIFDYGSCSNPASTPDVSCPRSIIA